MKAGAFGQGDAATALASPLGGEVPAGAMFETSRRGPLGWSARLLPPDPAQDLSRFAPVFTALRWSGLLVALALSMAQTRDVTDVLCVSGLASFTLWSTVRPPQYERGRWRTRYALLVEASLCVAIVEATGLGRSPFLVSLAVATLITGFVGGLRIVSWLALIAGLSIALPSLVLAQYHQTAGSSVQFATIFVVIGLVGGYSRHLLADADRVGQGLVKRVDHLSKVNDLLSDLHSAASRVTMPLELSGAARWALERLDEEFSPDVAAVILREPATGHWKVATAKGISHSVVQAPFSLNGSLMRAAGCEVPVLVENLYDGLAYRSRWGMYCPLRARGELVGILAVECDATRTCSMADMAMMVELATATALAVDNARWLERLHVLAVEQERTRLARELHDHVGQSIFYLGLELDRLAELNSGRAVKSDLLALRSDIRTLVEELRETLVELRCDVSENQDLAAVLHALSDRVNRRGKVEVVCSTEASTRLPLIVEREIWRVAREAVVNAERHALASHVDVLWTCDPEGALLEVRDDGVGLPAEEVAAPSRFGLLGMGERADAVGAQLEITSEPGKGTVVRMRMRAA